MVVAYLILVLAPVPVEPFGFRLGFGTGIGAKAYQLAENKTKYCITLILMLECCLSALWLVSECSQSFFLVLSDGSFNACWVSPELWVLWLWGVQFETNYHITSFGLTVHWTPLRRPEKVIQTHIVTPWAPIWAKNISYFQNFQLVNAFYTVHPYLHSPRGWVQTNKNVKFQIVNFFDKNQTTKDHKIEKDCLLREREWNYFSYILT